MLPRSILPPLGLVLLVEWEALYSYIAQFPTEIFGAFLVSNQAVSMGKAI
jgi:hypothetical protein